jgi:hypothetical protein
MATLDYELSEAKRAYERGDRVFKPYLTWTSHEESRAIIKRIEAEGWRLVRSDPYDYAEFHRDHWIWFIRAVRAVAATVRAELPRVVRILRVIDLNLVIVRFNVVKLVEAWREPKPGQCNCNCCCNCPLRR